MSDSLISSALAKITISYSPMITNKMFINFVVYICIYYKFISTYSITEYS